MSEDEEINVMDDGDEVLSMQEAQEVILADEKTHAIPLNQIFEGRLRDWNRHECLLLKHR